MHLTLFTFYQMIYTTLFANLGGKYWNDVINLGHNFTFQNAVLKQISLSGSTDLW